MVALGGAFAAFVVISMYTSAFAAGLVVGRLKSRVRTMSDLVSLPVGIYAVGRRWVYVGGKCGTKFGLVVGWLKSRKMMTAPGSMHWPALQ